MIKNKTIKELCNIRSNRPVPVNRAIEEIVDRVYHYYLTAGTDTNTTTTCMRYGKSGNVS